MTMLSLNVESQCLTQEKNLCEYELMVNACELNEITSELSDYLSQDNAVEDAYSAGLEAKQEIYDAKKESLESKLEVINAQIESYGKAITQNIKSECKFSLSC